MDSTRPIVQVTRWQAVTDRTQEFAAETSDDSHVVMIILRGMNIRLLVAGRTVQEGVATPGTFHVIPPGVSVRGMFCGPFDVLRLHVPNSLIAECAGGMFSHRQPTLSFHVTPARDRTVERLGRALLGAEQFGGPCGHLYADCIGIAIVARLLATGRAAAPRKRASVAELPQWRLKRAIDYVEARLAGPLSLSEIASATGLTPMHFAAQFRAATGLRPHEYLLRRRIERAQETLLGSGMSMVDVALSVGFQTQSHFTTVFKRFVGQSPGAWRQVAGRTRTEFARNDQDNRRPILLAISASTRWRPRL